MAPEPAGAPFTREEWLAILPAAAAPPPDVFAAGDAEAGAAEPAPPAVSVDEAAAAAARFSPLLALVGRTVAWWSKRGPDAGLGSIPFAAYRLAALVMVAALPAYATLFVSLPVGPFAAGIIAYALSTLVNAFLMLRVGLVVYTSPQRPWGGDTVAPWATQIYRWASLLPHPGGDAPPSALVEHFASDEELCTCPRASCAGKLPSQAAASYLIVALLRIALQLVVCPVLLWTPLVTLGPFVWSTSWGATMSTLVCACAVVSALPIAFRQVMFPNERMTELSMRIQRRAAVIVVGELVRTAREQPESLGWIRHDVPSAYVTFYRRMSGSWHSQGLLAFSHSFARHQAYVAIPLQLLGLVLNAAVGACFTAWQFLLLFNTGWISFALLLGIAAANARVSGVAEIFDSGRAALLELLVERPDVPPAAAAAIRDHAALLGCLAAKAPLAKWLGLPVTWGLVRTLAVTALTAFGALWGIVRGLGVTVTMESVCGVERLS